jgi:hypothetical protein
MLCSVMHQEQPEKNSNDLTTNKTKIEKRIRFDENMNRDKLEIPLQLIKGRKSPLGRKAEPVFSD